MSKQQSLPFESAKPTGITQPNRNSQPSAQTALTALTAAAALLPGLSSTSAEATQIADQYEFGYKHHQYDEEVIAAEDSLSGESERYDIDVHQFRLVAPVSDSVQINLDYQTEKMSGASPWYTFLLPSGKTVQVMSGASIADQRTDVAGQLSYFWEQQVAGITIARSKEDDYDSLAVGVNFTMDSEDRLNTYSIGFDVSNDDIYAVDIDRYPLRPQEPQSKRSQSVIASFARVLNKHTVVKFNLGYSAKSGYLSDPYKLTFVDYQLQADTRPSSRYANTAAVQLRYYNDTLQGALHVDYRYYRDSWSITSNTIDIAWYQNLGFGIQLTPSIRLYEQSAAYFYQHFYQQVQANGFHSNDYRLSEYGAVTYGLKLTKQWQDWQFNISAERYYSGGNVGLANSASENPALIDFELVSVGFNVKF